MIQEVKLGLQEGEVDSVTVAEMLGITKNNLRQLVFRKLLVPVSKSKRRSVFLLSDVERVKASRTPSVPSV
jgi:DNA-binding transcriptional MerR regulator